MTILLIGRGKVIKNLFRKTVFVHHMLRLSNLYQSIHIVQQELVLNEDDRCLLLAPHPDDESIGCGGLLLKYPDNFELICLTDGRHSDTITPKHELISTRKNEFETAMSKLGIYRYSFLQVEDRHLMSHYNVFSSIDIENYDYIFLPGFLDQQPDHKAVTFLLQKLLKERKYKSSLKIAFYEVWTSLALPNFYVDITENIEKKRDLISTHQSQIKSANYDERIIALNKYRGMPVNREYAEAFSIVGATTFLKLFN